MSLHMNKKVIAAAIGGLFVAAGAQAQVNLSATTVTPATFAQELVIPGTATGLALTNAGNALDLSTALRYAFSDGETRHARIECSSNLIFAAGSVTASAATASTGAINGVGTNIIFFSITATGGAVASTTTITVSGNRNITSNAPVTCLYGLYDTPSQAAAGGTSGRIVTAPSSGSPATYITFAPSYRLAVTPAGATANVEASPSFSGFVSASPTNSVTTAQIGRVRFDTRNAISAALNESPVQVQPLLASGTAGTLADFLAATSSHVFTGDFSAAANSDGTFTGAALARVFLAVGPDCLVAAVNANSITANSATFATGATAVDRYLCYTPRSGNLIAESAYSQSFTAVSAAPTTYSVAGIGPVAHGSITRNGTTLQAPLAQVPAGWLSRMVLTNTGTVARPYTITILSETGNTVTPGTLTGTVPASGMTVVDLSTVLTGFTTGQARRGALNVVVAGPNNTIQGVLQNTNPTSGSTSTYVMVRPGTN